MGKKVGYARVSTKDQDLELQISALKDAGCDRVYTDKASGSKTQRPGLDRCLSELESGDSLTVWRLDRLGRSMQHLISLVTDLRERGIGFRSLRDGAIDTTSASGDLVFNIFAALAQFERELIRERTNAGLAAARSRGRQGGRRPIRPDNPKVKMAKRMHEDHSMGIGEICSTLNVSRATFYRYLAIGRTPSP